MNSITKLDIDKAFGKILRDFRIKHRLTQEQLSEKLGISLKYISRIEKKVIKKLKSIVKI